MFQTIQRASYNEIHIAKRQMDELSRRRTRMDKQMKQLSSLSEKREALRDSYLLLISYKHVDPIAYEGIEQIWSRIWTAPQDLHMLYKKYAQVEKKQYKQLEALERSGCKHLDTPTFSSLIKEQRQAFQACKRVLEETQYRAYLTQLLKERMEEYVTKIEQYAPSQQASSDSAAPAAGTSLLDNTELRLPEEKPTRAPKSGIFAKLFAEAEESLKSGPERREKIRIDLGTVVQFGEQSHGFYTGFSENISSGGLFVASYDLAPQLGDVLSVTFSLPNGTVIETQGEVAWLREYSDDNTSISPGFGCRFIDMPDEEVEEINQYIKKEGSLFME
ncbi:MAG TPA: hypothetical protein DCE42_16770 [Myxococcales bacterium]|nr:hypothetical protein [Deltaproteobacteria bacterium]MBU50282.1 hypothetical protein [Deltaproteobacteria bacterium]HAA56421.1 hypothetical protein [Myxococcales bacterium]|tara:strand:- start:11339 stop:12334 length:996 start_codon:yes stop_codon:yes gene_type:complete